VEQLTRASQVIKDVLYSNHRIMAAAGKKKRGSAEPWNGQWGKAHGDTDTEDDGDASEDDIFYNESWNDCDLDIPNTSSNGALTGKDTTKNSKATPKPTFVKASHVLSKYEMLECQEGNSKGFVNFRSKNGVSSGGGPPRRIHPSKKFSSSAALLTQEEEQKKNNVQAIVIPEHLRATAPDPLQHLSKKSSTTATISGGIKQQQQQSSLELSQQAKKLKAEMDALKQQRAERLKALKERTKGKR